MSPKSGKKRNERSRATRELREKRRKRGDVEIHIRASDWFAHMHHTDVCYNNVILHIVLICDDSQPTLRQDGTTIPTCSLHDLPSTIQTHKPMQWSCHAVLARMNDEERACILIQAGTLRFEAKTRAFFKHLQNAQPSYRNPSAKAPVIDPLDEAPFFVWGSGEECTPLLDSGELTCYDWNGRSKTRKREVNGLQATWGAEVPQREDADVSA